MTDNAFLLSVLNDGRWHSNTEILQASFVERGCGLTVHSRASDLRKKGYTVETRNGERHSGRRVCYYRLVGALNEAAVEQTPPAASLSASPIPADSIAGAPDGRGGDALTLFADRRGAYGDDAA